MFTGLERRGIACLQIDAGAHVFELAEQRPPYDLVFNRASPSNRGLRSGLVGTAERVAAFEQAGADLLLLQFSL